MKCPIRIINGTENHVHCLFMLNRQISISQVIKQVKGSSSRFINEQNLLEETFEWQVGYGAFSISEKEVDKVYFYIKNQKAHHKNQSAEAEYDILMKNKRYLW